MTRSLFLLVPIWMAAGSLLAQDTTRVDEGVRVGVDYSPGTRPGLVVLPGSGLDSARAMIRRDLDYSDRFEMITVGDQVATTGGGASPQSGPVNYELYKGMGAEFAVELSQATGGLTMRHGSEISRRYRCLPALTFDWRSTAWPTRSPAGQAAPPVRPPAACCSSPVGGCIVPTAMGMILPH
jgi:hypothetical protein